MGRKSFEYIYESGEIDTEKTRERKEECCGCNLEREKNASFSLPWHFDGTQHTIMTMTQHWQWARWWGLTLARMTPLTDWLTTTPTLDLQKAATVWILFYIQVSLVNTRHLRRQSEGALSNRLTFSREYNMPKIWACKWQQIRGEHNSKLDKCHMTKVWLPKIEHATGEAQKGQEQFTIAIAVAIACQFEFPSATHASSTEECLKCFVASRLAFSKHFFYWLFHGSQIFQL